MPLFPAGADPRIAEPQATPLHEAIAKGLAQLERGERVPYDPAVVRALAEARFLNGERPDPCVVP